MHYVIGIDGGGTKTDIVLCSEDGAVIKRKKTSGSNHQIIGCPEAIRILKNGIEEIVHENLSENDQLDYIMGGLAGADFEEDVSLLRGKLKNEFPDVNIEILNDVWLPLAAEVPDGPAAVSVCGTGHNTALRLKNGKKRQISALDFILGNGNGGTMICDLAFHYACRAAEFTGPETRLASELPDLYAQPDMLTLQKWMYLHSKAGIHKAGVSQLVCRLAAEGDPVSENILISVATRQAEMTLGLIRHEKMEQTSFPLVLSGSVYLSDDSYIVREKYCEMIHKGCPGAKIILSRSDPVVGAVLMALISDGRYSPILHEKIVAGIQAQ